VARNLFSIELTCSQMIEFLLESARHRWRARLLPNVKDEPRRELARRVQDYDSLSVVSFRIFFGRTRRDRSQRWLWRLVGLCGFIRH
jgi:hypothetical protein